MTHDFKKFPELSNRQMEVYYFESPHKQITENFEARVVKVTDGDTIRVKAEFRNFDFPVRFINTAAPERDEPGGKESRNWLEELIFGEDVEIEIDPYNRIGKWGRILGKIKVMGMDVNQMSIDAGHAVAWEDRKKSLIPDFNKELENVKWS